MNILVKIGIISENVIKLSHVIEYFTNIGEKSIPIKLFLINTYLLKQYFYNDRNKIKAAIITENYSTNLQLIHSPHAQEKSNEVLYTQSNEFISIIIIGTCTAIIANKHENQINARQKIIKTRPCE